MIPWLLIRISGGGGGGGGGDVTGPFAGTVTAVVATVASVTSVAVRVASVEVDT